MAKPSQVAHSFPHWLRFGSLAALSLGVLGACSASSDQGESVARVEQSVCDPDDPACQQGVAPPRPHWGEQPDRVAPVFVDLDPNNPSAGTGKVIACNPDLLGKMPVNPNPKGPDLQNISTNFHLLQSLQLLASAIQKTAASAEKFSSASLDEKQEGKCICKPDLSCSSMPELYKEKLNKEACQTYCDPTNTGPGDHAVCSAGFLNWLPNDVFKNSEGQAKWALKTIHWLDDIPPYITEGGLAQSLSAIGGELANLNDTMSLFQCYVDLFSEGYHLGSYSDDRPDLHMCVPYAGHGAYASLADSANGRWGIGARYTEHNLSREHRAQMRTGGFAITAFGKTLSVLPGVEFNLQVDGYKWFNRDAPLGIPALGLAQGGGIGLNTAKKVDVFDLVNDTQLTSLDSNRDGKVSPQEFLLATYMPFDYTPAGLPQAEWPRDGALAIDDWEGQEAAVIAAALNYEAKLKPIQKELPGIVIMPGATLIPYFKLAAGIGWHDEAYRLRTRLQEALNRYSAQKLDNADFNRDMHPFQAPDVTSEAGTKVSVRPEIGANLLVGFKLSKFAEIGVKANVGFSVDLKPGGSGGVVDLNSSLEKALVDSNPQGDLECKPTWSYQDQTYCSNKLLDGSDSSYMCTKADSHNSCCLTFAGPQGPLRACIDDWTGMSREMCDPKKLTKATIGQFVSPKIFNKVLGLMKYTFTTAWNANKSCDECELDGSCKNALRTPDFPDISGCEKHGYCCQQTAKIMMGTSGQSGIVDGVGTAAHFQQLEGGEYDRVTNSLYVGDMHTLRRIDLSTGQVVTLAGNGTPGFVDGIGTQAQLVEARGMALDANGILFIADLNRVRRFDPATKRLTTLVSWPSAIQRSHDIVSIGSDLYVSDVEGCAVFKVNPTSGAVTPFAGQPGTCGRADGKGNAARFFSPAGLAYDGLGSLYVSDFNNHQIRRIDLATAQVTTVAGTGQPGAVDGTGLSAVLDGPTDLTWDGADALYFTTGGNSAPTPTRQVRKFVLSTGEVTTIAGKAGGSYPLEGPARDIWISSPQPLVVDLEGNLWLGDGVMGVMREIGSGCDQSQPGAITYDGTRDSCTGTFTPYRCVTETKPTATGWTGPGCHPLHAGFPSACGCSSQLDCGTGETCDIDARLCKKNGQVINCTCDPAQAGVCGAARTCDEGACERKCSYSPATAATVCGPNLTCSPQGSCVTKGGMPFAEAVLWGAKHPQEPMHTIATYAMSELELIAALNAGINVGLKVKLFKKQREFSLWKWQQAFDLGSIEKAWFQPGLEASYQWDSSPLGLVTNYQPDHVTRYPAITADYDETKELLDWCGPAMAADVYDPIAPTVDQVGTGIVDTVEFGVGVGEAAYEQQQLCIGGKRMLEWLQNESSVTQAFGSGTCKYTGPQSARGPRTFPCQRTHTNLLRLWGCLDVKSSQSTLLAARFPQMVDGTTTPRTLNLEKMMVDPTGPVEASNISISSSNLQSWLDEVEVCFNDHYEETVPCTCSADLDCKSGPGQKCVSGTCQNADKSIAQCSPVKSTGVQVGMCCGDGILERGEQCDDGNSVAGDGCAPSCVAETVGACCLADGCSNFGPNGIDAASCRAQGGNPIKGYSCDQVDQCGFEPLGTCQIGDDCLSPATERQCTTSQGTFTLGGTCSTCVAQPEGMSAWYPLDEKTTTVAHDVIGSNNGVYEGDVPRISGVVHGAANILDGDAVRVPSAAELNFGTGDFTVSTWVRTTAGGTIFEKRSNTAIGQRGVLFTFWSGDRFLVQLADEPSGWMNYVSPSGTGATDGKWHLITLSVDRDRTDGGKVYVDDRLFWTFNPTGRKGSLNNDAALTIGVGYDVDEVDGGMDELMFFKRVLNASEVARIAKAGADGVCR